MANPVFKRFRGYIAPALLGYTVLVTFLLVQTAWNDDTRVRKAGKNEATRRYVPSKEEMRHLRSIEDVDGVGNQESNRGERIMTNYGRGKFPALQNGRKVQSSYTNDFYVDEVDINATDINGTLVDGVLPPGGRDYILESRLYQSRSDTMARRQIAGNSDQRIKLDTSSTNKRKPDHPNIEIEEMIPVSANESSSDSNVKSKSVLQFRHHSLKDRNAVDTGQVVGSPKVKDRLDAQNPAGITDTHFCDNIEQDGKLCYRDRIVYSHRNHVNISSTHQSFKGFGGLRIYSAFLDTRQSPPTIRIMTVGPNGYGNGGSSLWCAFTSPLAVTRRNHWTGEEDNIASGQTRATQLYFYAASDGHDKNKQFYVMSCEVPQKYLRTLTRLDGNRIDVVAGTQDSALMDTIQERVPITVINNKGLPWHVLKQQALSDSNGRNVRLHENRRDAQSALEIQQKLPANSNNNDDNNINQNWVERGSMIAQNVNQLRLSDNLGSDEGSWPTDAPVLSKDASDSLVRQTGVQDAIVSCVAPLYGITGIVQMTEFIELTLLLGSQHIVFYTPRISPDVQNVLKMYKDQGLVTIMPWDIPDAADIWAKGRDVALNDCLYRTMSLYDYVIFHDVDEFLIPRATPDLPSLLGFLRTKGRMNTTRISDIVFNSAYFPPPSKTQSDNLMTMPGYTKEVPKFLSLRSLHRTYFSSQHTIRIIRPTSAMRVGAGERKRTSFHVNPRFAGVNHYTKCPVASTTTDNNSVNRDRQESSKSGQGTVDCNHTKWDDGIWKYKDKLIQNTKDSIRAFNALGKPKSR